jgi:hypothetical protein
LLIGTDQRFPAAYQFPRGSPRKNGSLARDSLLNASGRHDLSGARVRALPRPGPPT